MFVDAATLADYTNLYNAEQGGGVVKSGDTCWTVHPTFANPTGGAITVAQTYPSCEDCLPNCGDCHFDEGSTIDINNLDQILCRNGDSSFSEHKYYGAISFDYFDSTQWVWSGNITHELWNGVTGDNCDGGGTPDDTDTETLTINYDCASNTWYLHFVNNYIDLNHMVYDGCSGGHLVNGPSGSYDAINSGSFTVSDGGGP